MSISGDIDLTENLDFYRDKKTLAEKTDPRRYGLLPWKKFKPVKHDEINKEPSSYAWSNWTDNSSFRITYNSNDGMVLSSTVSNYSDDTDNTVAFYTPENSVNYGVMSTSSTSLQPYLTWNNWTNNNITTTLSVNGGYYTIETDASFIDDTYEVKNTFKIGEYRPRFGEKLVSCKLPEKKKPLHKRVMLDEYGWEVKDNIMRRTGFIEAICNVFSLPSPSLYRELYGRALSRKMRWDEKDEEAYVDNWLFTGKLNRIPLARRTEVFHSHGIPWFDNLNGRVIDDYLDELHGEEKDYSSYLTNMNWLGVTS